MAANSFRTDLGHPPAHYRTPSPPNHLVEPLSPGTAAWSQIWSQPFHNFERNERLVGEAYSYRRNGESDANMNGDHKMIDGFATTNFATSHQQQLSQAPTHIWNHHPATKEVRPSKRARSEKASSSNWHNVGSRPSTSYLPPSDETRRLDAELLLNFSREACNTNHTWSISSQGYQDTADTSEIPALHSPSAGRQLSSTSHAPVKNFFQDAYQTQKTQFSGSTSLDTSYQSSAESGKGGRSLNKHHGIPIAHNGLSSSTNGEASKEHTPLQNGDTRNAHPQFENGTSTAQLDQDLDLSSKKQPLAETQIGTLESARFLDGIEEAAKAARLPFEAPVSVQQVDSKAKQKQLDIPSVCAACNFTRNTLTAETENDATSWICCDGCKSWFHFACAGFKNEREVRGVDKYRCRKCKPIHGATTYVRKSARAHSAIDYAGLNEGIVKTSDENPEHHYIKPIKEGTIKFDQETFARMRPELVTADYFAKGDGMKEPILIPAAFNPRPRRIPDSDSDEIDANGASSALHDLSILDQWFSEGFEYDQVPDCGQDTLDMVIPLDLTVRKVAHLFGPDEKIEVIDVKSQNGEDRKWNMKRWADYYESTGNKVVRNVISLEVSQSKLGRLIRRPKVVRDLDLQDSVWPEELTAKGDFPKVQFYCLMSVADCFTDFHIDFGGSSVYYHILKGKKTFFFIPPHEKHLKKYEEWCNSPAQNWTFLGDQTKECYRVDLSEGDTMLIPAGWIHAVWTPEDSLVIGGNFLTRMHYQMQIRVTQIEKATHVARKFRYPHFQKVMWYAALRYLADDPLPDSVKESLGSGRKFQRDVPTHLDFDGWGQHSDPEPESFHTRYYPKAELDGLPDLGRYLHRSALIASGHITEGISTETRNAVKRSIPKVIAEPFDIVKKFAMWYSWKRGDEHIPHWAYPAYMPEGSSVEPGEKKLSAKALKKLDREAALSAWRVAPDRQSTRPRNQPQSLLAEMVNGQVVMGTLTGNDSPPPTGDTNSSSLKRKPDSMSPAPASQDSAPSPVKKSKSGSGVKAQANRRPACEPCRKGRRACKHRDDPNFQPNGSGAEAQDSIRVLSTPTKFSQGVQGDRAVSLPCSSAGMGMFQKLDPGQISLAETSPPEASFGRNSPTGALVALAGPGQDSESTSVQAKTPGRSKACRDCRKSKRRCVHDEDGNEDPAKLAEPAVPRPAAKKKRASGEGFDNSPPKRIKGPTTPQAALESRALPNSDGMIIDPAILEPPIVQQNGNIYNGNDLEYQPLVTGDISVQLDDSSAEGTNTVTDTLAATLSILPAAFSLDDEVNLIATSPMSDVKVEPPFEGPALSSNPSVSQQVVSTLVSPPESTHTDAEQSPPATVKSRGFTPPTTSVSSRHSSRPPAKNTQRYTPESGSARRASTSSVGQAIETGSPLASMPSSASHKRTKSRLSSMNEVDEEDLKLIRELTAQDMGLRRRARGTG